MENHLKQWLNGLVIVREDNKMNQTELNYLRWAGEVCKQEQIGTMENLETLYNIEQLGC